MRPVQEIAHRIGLPVFHSASFSRSSASISRCARSRSMDLARATYPRGSGNCLCGNSMPHVSHVQRSSCGPLSPFAHSHNWHPHLGHRYSGRLFIVPPVKGINAAVFTDLTGRFCRIIAVFGLDTDPEVAWSTVSVLHASANTNRIDKMPFSLATTSKPVTEAFYLFHCSTILLPRARRLIERPPV